jgi:hypothetical protein
VSTNERNSGPRVQRIARDHRRDACALARTSLIGQSPMSTGRFLMVAASTAKYRFRIKTRDGWELDNLIVHGRDRAHAEKKLRQMYLYCEILAGESCAFSAPTQRLFELHHLANRPVSAV